MIRFSDNFHVCAYSSDLENGQTAAFVYLYFLKEKTPKPLARWQILSC